MRTNELIILFIIIIFGAFIFAFELRCLLSLIIKKKIPKNRFSFIIHALAIISLLCFLYGYFIEPYWVEVKDVEIRTHKLKNTELTIVLISDLHCDKKIRNEKKLPVIINALHPDVIVFTGDALNTPEALTNFKETLSAMKAEKGKYAVRGNFDTLYWESIPLFKDTGFVELNGQLSTFLKNGEPFAISGLSVNHDSVNFTFFRQFQSDTYNIFLYHYPGIHEAFPDIPIDLFLSGHTHGGQVALPFYGALITLSKYGKKYESGRYDVGEKVVYVNRGIGMEGGIAPRIRFCARPEITVFHIQPSLSSVNK